MPNTAPGLESGRYKVLKAAPKTKETPKIKIIAVPANPEPPAVSTPQVTIVSSNSTASPVGPALTVSTPTEVPPTPTISDQIQELVVGNAQPKIEAYKEQIHEDDVRLNLVEIDLTPGAVVNSSKSNYAFRDYSSVSPSLSVGGKFWLTPFVGIYGSYVTTMGADVDGGTVNGSKVAARHEWNEVGFDYRTFFGLSRKSNSIQYGVHISEYRFSVPSDETARVNLRSSGVGLHIQARLPVVAWYAWTLGGKLIPRIQQSELQTGVDLSSGDAGESSRVDLNVGGEFKFSRESQLIWNLNYSFEKNHFSGTANTTDPRTGLKPQGVSVENAFTMFTLGYRWGR